MRPLPSLLVALGWMHFAVSLTLLERNELSRKFKYYFKSVRPVSRDNFVSDQNGTHFTIDTHIQLLKSVRTQSSVALEAFVVCKFIDDRLLLRELYDRFEVTEFEPWEPRVGTSPPVALKTSVFLEPQTGEVNYYYRVKEVIPCSTESWRHPFELFTCDLAFENSGDEVLRVVDHRDARPDAQTRQVGLEIVESPSPTIRLWFRSSWQTALVSVFLPSFLVFAVVVFAQWKRRKIQVIVTVTALICIIILLSSQRVYPSLTLRDLWLCSSFLHTVFLLVVDLTLPARRVRYTLLVDVNGKPTNLASPESSPEAPPSRPSTSTSSLRVHRIGSDTTTEAADESARESERTRLPVHWVDEDDDGFASPILGGRKAMMAIQKIAGRLGQTKVESRVIRGCPGQQVPVQRQVTANSLGHRKRLALLAVCVSYALFCLVYLVVALCLV